MKFRRVEGIRKSRTLTPAYFTSRHIFLPAEVIFHLSKFLQFGDFRNFIKATWPKGEEDETFQQRLWQLSSRKFVAKFLDRTEIEVLYHYDVDKVQDDRVKIELKSVLPILGGVMPPCGNKFVSLGAIRNYLETNMTMHLCDGGKHSPCVNFVESSTAKEHVCDQKHYHHYCPHHVYWWFYDYLVWEIRCREEQNEQRESGLIWLEFCLFRRCDLNRKDLQPNFDLPEFDVWNMCVSPPISALELLNE